MQICNIDFNISLQLIILIEIFHDIKEILAISSIIRMSLALAIFQ